MKKYCVLFAFCFFVIGCDNDLSNVGNSNTGNENQITGENPNDGNENTVVNYLHLLRGTIWNADRGSHFIEFSGNQILFRNRQNFGSIGGNLNTTVTHGNFRLSSFDGETMKLLDFDNNVVEFTVIIDEDRMTVTRLNAIRWTAPPFQPRFFGQWNGTYTRAE